MIHKFTDIDENVIFGNNITVKSFTVIYGNVIIGNNVIIGHNTIIRENSIIEDNVYIGNLCQIQGDCKIGEYTRFPTNVHITKKSIVGKNCFIAPGFVSTNTYHPLCPECKKCTKGIIIEDDVKIGANVTTAPGITIGRNSLIGIGSVITKDIPPNSYVHGIPARVICSISELKCKFNYIDKPYR